MKIPKPRWGVATLAALVLLASTARPGLAQPPEYRLGYGDAVSITVVGQPALSVADQPVRPDGRIAMPLIAEVSLQGKTVSEVAKQLNTLYRPFLATPQVVVSVTRFRPTRITLLGQVKQPGTFDFQQAPTLIEALAAAGGLSDRAARGTIVLVRTGTPAETFDLDQLLRGQVPMPRVQEGTVIEVGEVWGPDWYRVLPIAASMVTAGAILARDWYWW